MKVNYKFLSLAFLLLLFMSIKKIDEPNENKSGEGKLTLTQEELDQKVNEEVKKRIEDVKKKSISDLTRELFDKELKLDQKEKEIVAKAELLKKQEDELSLKIAEFTVTQEKFLGCTLENKKNKSQRADQLVEMISNMKPDKAAALLSVQSSKISVLILSKMEPIRASKIFNLMDKEISARLQKEYLNMKQ
ncbi:hypothetical protein N9N67_06160 [Bacteriovoracaceae bacterium]|nr:hypothetical protein [Bacteriovoracaceae bacterium]